MWVPGSGSIETWDLVIDENYCYGHLSFSGLGSAKPLVDGFWEYVDKRGGDMNPNRMAFTQICCVAETEEQAEKDYAEAVRYFYTHNPTSPAYVQPPGYHTQATLQAQMARGGGRLTNEDRMKAARGELCSGNTTRRAPGSGTHIGSDFTRSSSRSSSA